MEYSIEVYQTVDGKLPFDDWLNHLSDVQARQKIRVRIERLILGNFGDCRALQEGVSELKIDFGPGYRIYFASIGKTKMLILYAGTKRTQKKDIERSIKYFNDFKMRGKKYAKK